MLKLITSLGEARANVLDYNQGGRNLRSFPGGVQASFLNTISHAQVWLAIFEAGDWQVAPAKYVGYQDITPERYHSHRQRMSGSKAAARLDELGVSWDALSGTHNASRALDRFARGLGKARRDGSSVYMLPGEDLLPSDRKVAEGIAEAIERSQLSRKALEYLEIRLAAMLA